MTRVFLFRLAGAALIALMLSLLIATYPVRAATLKAMVTTDQDVITLGDLVEGAGDLASRPIFRSPDAGIDGVLPVDQALAVARAAGLTVSTPTFRNIRVSRETRVMTSPALTRMLLPALAERIGAREEDANLTLNDAPDVISTDASSDEPVVIQSITVRPGGNFSAELSVDIGASDKVVRITGSIVETVTLPVLIRPLGRGEIIRSNDLTMAQVDRRRANANAVLDPGLLVGLAARRPLRAGEALAALDVESPKVITRNQSVTLLYERPGITLTARGRALADGAVGETIAVINDQSHRTVQGRIAANGAVIVDPVAPRSLTQ